MPAQPLLPLAPGKQHLTRFAAGFAVSQPVLSMHWLVPGPSKSVATIETLHLSLCFLHRAQHASCVIGWALLPSTFRKSCPVQSSPVLKEHGPTNGGGGPGAMRLAEETDADEAKSKAKSFMWDGDPGPGGHRLVSGPDARSRDDEVNLGRCLITDEFICWSSTCVPNERVQQLAICLGNTPNARGRLGVPSHSRSARR